jgi:hypothetical protein
MNQVTLTVTISRANPRQCLTKIERDGRGDDLVEHRADYFERVLVEAGEYLIQEGGQRINEAHLKPE